MQLINNTINWVGLCALGLLLASVAVDAAKSPKKGHNKPKAQNKPKAHSKPKHHIKHKSATMKYSATSVPEPTMVVEERAMYMFEDEVAASTLVLEPMPSMSPDVDVVGPPIAPMSMDDPMPFGISTLEFIPQTTGTAPTTAGPVATTVVAEATTTTFADAPIGTPVIA
jgi:hypothetical protein